MSSAADVVVDPTREITDVRVTHLSCGGTVTFHAREARDRIASGEPVTLRSTCPTCRELLEAQYSSRVGVYVSSAETRPVGIGTFASRGGRTRRPAPAATGDLPPSTVVGEVVHVEPTRSVESNTANPTERTRSRAHRMLLVAMVVVALAAAGGWLLHLLRTPEQEMSLVSYETATLPELVTIEDPSE